MDILCICGLSSKLKRGIEVELRLAEAGKVGKCLMGRCGIVRNRMLLI